MTLIQILLPVTDPAGHPFPSSLFTGLRYLLTEQFGGVTVFSRSPAEGFWDDENGIIHDGIVIFEVMCDRVIDVEWWSRLKQQLEHDFRQKEIIIRAHSIQLL